jgi:hypothetical protein
MSCRHPTERRRRATLLGLALAPGFALAAGLAAGSPATAESQSSNSSSNCSDGRCTRVETRLFEDDRGGVRGWRRVETWDERPGRAHRHRSERAAPWQERPGRYGPPRRGRRDDD